MTMIAVGLFLSFYHVPKHSTVFHSFVLIDYRLYGIKYKYLVVAIHYSQSCICLLPAKSLSTLLYLCLVWTESPHLNTIPLIH